MIELRSSTGQLDFSRITPEIIEAMDEPRQRALLALMKATEAKDAAVERRNAATRRLDAAILDEDQKQAADEDASSPIQFGPIVAKLEDAKGGPLNEAELQEARAAHVIRVRAHREAMARAAAVAAFNANV